MLIHSLVCSCVQTIHLEFVKFSVEETDNCGCDYMKTYDGTSEQAPLLRTDCGWTIPSPIDSTGNAMFVTFVSDDSVSQDGFRVKYTTVDGGSTDDTPIEDDYTPPEDDTSVEDDYTGKYIGGSSHRLLERK